MRRSVRNLADVFVGRAALQPFFGRLYDLSLAGLNVGQGNRQPSVSGERGVIKMVAKRRRHGSTPLVMFDVGANEGDYTREILEELGDAVLVWCFEPSPSAFALLDSRFGKLRNVRLNKLGLSNVAGVGTLHSPRAASKAASLYDRRRGRKRSPLSLALSESVDLTTLDRFCAEQNISHIDLLKLDVEGHELSVLHGARGMLNGGRIDVIQFEFGGPNVDSRTFFRDFYDLLANDYAIFRVLRKGVWPITEYSDEQEVFRRATNYVAMRPVGAAPL